MSYVADDGAWAQRIRQEMNIQHKSLQQLFSNRGIINEDQAAYLSGSYNQLYGKDQFTPSFSNQYNSLYLGKDAALAQAQSVSNKDKSFRNQTQNAYFSNNRTSIGDEGANLNLQESKERLLRSKIGQRLLSLNSRLVGASQQNTQMVSPSNSKLLNLSSYAFGGTSSIKKSQMGGVFAMNDLQDDQQALLQQSNSVYKNSSILHDVRSDKPKTAGLRQSLDSRRKTLQDLAQKIRLQRVNNQSSHSKKRQITIQSQDNSSQNLLVKDIHEQTFTKHRPDTKQSRRFNENPELQILDQRSTVSQKSNLTKQNLLYFQNYTLNPPKGDEVKSRYSSLRSSKIQGGLNKNQVKQEGDGYGDSMSHYKTTASNIQQNQQPMDDSYSNRVSRVGSQYSKVRGKLIEAIQKIDKEKLNELQEKIKEITNQSEVEVKSASQNLRYKQPEDQNPEEQDIYQDTYLIKQQAAANDDQTNQINPLSGGGELKQSTKLLNQAEISVIENFDKNDINHSNYQNNINDDKYSQLERKLKLEQFQRHKLEKEVSNLQALFYQKVNSTQYTHHQSFQRRPMSKRISERNSVVRNSIQQDVESEKVNNAYNIKTKARANNDYQS